MKKRFWLFSLFAVTLLLTACHTNAEDSVPASSTQNKSAPASPSVWMEATVTEAGERLLVEVTRSDYTSGPHIVLVNDGTVIEDEDGNPLSASSIKQGDKLTILYSGQVMLSYPPQIVALRIIVQ